MQANLWNELPHPKLFVYPWDAGYQPDASDTVRKLGNAISALLSIPKPSVGAPHATTIPSRKLATPWCFLVTNLTPTAMKTLIKQRYWSSSMITFFAVPFSPPISSYIYTIENLTYDESEAHNVLQLVKTTIRNSEQAAAHVKQENTDPDALHAIIQSTRVSPLRFGVPAKIGGGTKLVWNIYIDPPSQSPAKH
jgi:hypothetical protein